MFKNRMRLAREFSPSDWLALIEAWWGLLYFHLALRWVSLGRLGDLAASGSRQGADALGELSNARRCHRLVHLAARLHFISITCLDRSLTLQRMLSRRGVPMRLLIGVGRFPGRVRAHAWVEVHGEMVGEAPDLPVRFGVLGGQAPFCGTISNAHSRTVNV